jgi:DNA replication ATP-dependent helicase Dna2
LKANLNFQKIVGVTCLGSAHPLIAQSTFDICLVDEATQILQCSIIRPLLSSTKFILVGDPEQLPPLVRSNEAKELGADESLFKRLDSEEATKVLYLQYRMNKVITKLSNSLTYKGELKCANEIVEKAVLQIPRAKEMNSKFSNEKWMIRALSSHLEQSCILLNTGNVFEMVESFRKVDKSSEDKDDSETKEKNRIYQNYCEAAIVIHVIRALTEVIDLF